MATYRVLVFGSTGVGKTSLCNNITGQCMRVDSTACGTTFETHTYQPFTAAGHTFYITDTVGLNEGEYGTVPAAKAAEQLVELLLQSEQGFNILLHVFKMPRRDKAHDDNYALFVKEMTQESIPTILVATGCENEEPMSAWAARNREHLSKGCKYKEVIASCFAEGGRLESVYAPLRAESRQQLLTAIIRHALSEPKLIYKKEDGIIAFNKIFTQFWNVFTKLAGKPQLRKELNETVHDFLVRQGVPKAVAEVITRDFLDIVEIVAPPHIAIGLNIMTLIKKLIKKPV